MTPSIICFSLIRTFFVWFVYGNLIIVQESKELEEASIDNRAIMYYIVFLLLVGYFVYSKVIFYLIFFISFMPCLVYMIVYDEGNLIIPMGQPRLRELTFKETGLTEGECVICTNQYLEDDRIGELECRGKHMFHLDCIERWLGTRRNCPLCREVV